MTVAELQAIIGLDDSALKRGLERAESDLKQFARQANQAADSIRSIERAGRSMIDMGMRMSIGISLPMVAAGVAAARAATDFDTLRRGLDYVTGSATETARQLDRLREISRQPGIGFREAIEGSVRLQAAGLPAAQAERTLKEFANALAAVGRSKEGLEGVNRALGQILGKNRVMAEEVNQIAEWVPQIRQIMTQTFGTANTEVIAAAGLSSRQFIDAIVEQLARLPRATLGLRAQFEILTDNFFIALSRIGTAAMPELTAATENLARVLETLSGWFERLPQGTQTTILSFAAVVAATGPLLLYSGLLIDSFTKVRRLFVGWGALRTGVISFWTGLTGVITGNTVALAANTTAIGANNAARAAGAATTGAAAVGIGVLTAAEYGLMAKQLAGMRPTATGIYGAPLGPQPTDAIFKQADALARASANQAAALQLGEHAVRTAQSAAESSARQLEALRKTSQVGFLGTGAGPVPVIITAVAAAAAGFFAGQQVHQHFLGPKIDEIMEAWNQYVSNWADHFDKIESGLQKRAPLLERPQVRARIARLAEEEGISVGEAQQRFLRGIGENVRRQEEMIRSGGAPEAARRAGQVPGLPVSAKQRQAEMEAAQAVEDSLYEALLQRARNLALGSPEGQRVAAEARQVIPLLRQRLAQLTARGQQLEQQVRTSVQAQAEIDRINARNAELMLQRPADDAARQQRVDEMEALRIRAAELAPSVADDDKLRREFWSIQREIFSIQGEGLQFEQRAVEEAQQERKRQMDLAERNRELMFAAARSRAQTMIGLAPEGVQRQAEFRQMGPLLEAQMRQVVAEARQIVEEARVNPDVATRYLELEREYWDIAADYGRMRRAAQAEIRSQVEQTQREQREVVNAFRQYQLALVQNMVRNAPEDVEKFEAASKFIPILQQQQQDLIAEQRNYNDNQREYWDLGRQIVEVEGRINDYARDANKDRRRQLEELINKERDRRNEQQDILELQTRLVSERIRNNPLLTEQQQTRILIPFLLRQYQEMLRPVQGETVTEALKREIEAERIRGDILGGLGVSRDRMLRTAGGLEFAGNPREVNFMMTLMEQIAQRSRRTPVLFRPDVQKELDRLRQEPPLSPTGQLRGMGLPAATQTQATVSPTTVAPIPAPQIPTFRPGPVQFQSTAVDVTPRPLDQPRSFMMENRRMLDQFMGDYFMAHRPDRRQMTPPPAPLPNLAERQRPGGPMALRMGSPEDEGLPPRHVGGAMGASPGAGHTIQIYIDPNWSEDRKRREWQRLYDQFVGQQGENVGRIPGQFTPGYFR